MEIQRIQTGVRVEKTVKILKAIAEFHDYSLGEMLELILLHAFEGRQIFKKESLQAIKEFKKIYGFDYQVHDYIKFIEKIAPGFFKRTLIELIFIYLYKRKLKISNPKNESHQQTFQAIC
ncbi:MAG: hypothetical protein R3A45_00465 [Bdellovibrionota bacterium]